MQNIWSIFKRELRAYFDSPIAYVVITVFLLFTGWYFTTYFFLSGQADLRVILGIIPFAFLIITPAITMRLISEERKTGTIELLVTMPIHDSSIIVGKYLAAVALLIAMILPTLVYGITAAFLGDMDYGPAIGGYLGFLLIGAAYIAIGILGSSLTENQVVAFIISLLVDGTSVETIEEGQEASLILETTPFYAEMGGQTGDTGEISGRSGRFAVALHPP